MRKDAIFNSSRAALLVASMITGNIDNLKMAMDDRLHQPYRMQLVPGMDGIFKAADPAAMVEEMISALRAAWDEKHKA